ncbi:ribosome silencing factor [Oceanospirillum linum]|uniref:Ribosomal silencing factor RsfS n=1 Tax=Oceanospirillum linum TaxID=966 RepID=A0A1T1H9K8_OCELI|nr:ribosome silencing factor [Oceanospirillum linum]OOV86523.1 ribosome silencing factor [Oceanospirillum linum]SEG35736.1 ribosome-associated protein [Oleiphilus messinensis]SMP29946.1 ribosome-associated protein [Oceanospirillum linum]
MQTEQLKQLVIDSLEEMKGNDIVVLDVRGNTSVTDFMVIASGTSNRHVASMANNVVVNVKEQGVRPLGVEGQTGSEWVLVDLGGIVVHIMQPATRQFYDLERLWSDLPEDSVVESGIQESSESHS